MSDPTRRTPAPLDLDVTRGRLERLGLAKAAESLDACVTEAVKEETSPQRFLDRLLDSELLMREERRVRTSLRLSGAVCKKTPSASGAAAGRGVRRISCREEAPRWAPTAEAGRVAS